MMTTKEATQTMLRRIKFKYTQENNYEKVKKDKEIAQELGLTPACYSRLVTGVTEPKIATWFKIIQLHKIMCGDKATMEIIEQIE